MSDKSLVTSDKIFGLVRRGWVGFCVQVLMCRCVHVSRFRRVGALSFLDATPRVRGRLRCVVGVPVLLLLCAVMPEEAAAHGDGPVTPENVWSAWNVSPTILLLLAAAVAVYVQGLRRLWAQAGVGGGVARWQAYCFGGGILALALALISPLAGMAGSLFSAHMVQHLTFIIIAAPLLVLGAPIYVMLWALPERWRRSVGRWWKGAHTWQAVTGAVTHPIFTWTVFAVTIWFWHVPLFYEAARENHLLHMAEHVSILVAAMLFCWVLINPMGRRLSRGMGVVYLFATSIHGSLLGALLTFSPRPWFSTYLETAEAWHLTPLQDQQLAGLIMWVPGGFVYVAFAALLFGLWLKEFDTELLGAQERRMHHNGRSSHLPRIAEEE